MGIWYMDARNKNKYRGNFDVASKKSLSIRNRYSSFGENGWELLHPFLKKIFALIPQREKAKDYPVYHYSLYRSDRGNKQYQHYKSDTKFKKK